MSSISGKLQHVRSRIEAACAAAGRPVQSVTLLAVSKMQTALAVREVCAAGQHHVAENYVQEARRKQADLEDLRGTLCWHFVGALQRNKTREVAEHFDWVHAIDRLDVAQRLSSQRPAALAPLQICLQVNVDAEASKAGVAPDAVEALARAVAALPRLRLRGLMSIPEPTTDPARQRAQHHRLRDLLEGLRRGGIEVDTLSMGMSADLEAAITEGATIVRVGTAIFGERARPAASPTTAAG